MPNHRSLSPILGFGVFVRILPRKVVVCCDFILRAVATFWVMSLVGIYPDRASTYAVLQVFTLTERSELQELQRKSILNISVNVLSNVFILSRYKFQRETALKNQITRQFGDLLDNFSCLFFSSRHGDQKSRSLENCYSSKNINLWHI